MDKKILYINIRELLGDIILVTKVDTLNTISNRKQLPVVSKSDVNSKIEVFANSKAKANIDEVTISNGNIDTETEKKANKKKKWLIGIGIALGCVAIGVAGYLLFKKMPKNIVKPKISNTNPQIDSLISDMTDFLTANKGKHIGSDDIISIFKKHRPDMNLEIIDDVVEKPLGSLFSGGTASSGVKVAEDLSGYTSYNMTLRSKSFMDKLKSLLHIKNSKKTFYVTNSFADNLLHESTHVMQHATKPTQLAYQRTLQSSLPCTGGWISGFNVDNAFTYNDLVYKEELFFNKNNFIKKLMKRIRTPYYMKNKEEMVAVQLKQLIREAQAEKQAYELGKLNQLRYRFPRLSQNSRIDAFFQERAIKYADGFKWGDKIEMMKEEYFNLIQAIRKSRTV